MSRFARPLAVVVAMLSAELASAGAPYLIEETRPELPGGPNGDFDPAPLTALDAKLLLTARTAATGRELWAYDPAQNSATILFETEVGEQSSDLDLLANNGARAFFGDPPYSVIWATDGSPDGTVAVAGGGPTPTTTGVFDGACTTASGHWFFLTEGPESSHRLWASDGTIDGTELIHEVSVFGALPDWCSRIADDVWFAAVTESFEIELWKSGGTAATTTKLGELASVPFGSPDWIVGDKLLFFGEYPYPLWALDLEDYSSEELLSLTTNGSGASVERRLRFGAGRAAFLAWNASDGEELWSTDGTASGTFRLTNLGETFAFGYGLDGDLFGVTASRVVFLGGEDDEIGLWSVPVEGGALVALDGVCAWSSCVFYPGLHPINDRLVFQGESAGFGAGVHVTDGTPAGTGGLLAAAGVEPYIHDFWREGSQLLFVGYSPLSGRQLWATDGTQAGTVRLTGIPGEGDLFEPESYEPDPVVNAFDRYWFRACLAPEGCELWSSEGSPESTQLVLDLGFEPSLSEIGNLLPVSLDRVAFVAGDWWLSDGSAAGTAPLGFPEEHTFQLDSPRDDGGVIDGSLLVSSWSASPPPSTLYVADLETEGVTQLTVFDEENLAWAPFAFASGVGFFVEDGGQISLWSSGGTPGSTQKLFDLPIEIYDVGYPRELGGRLYFVASDDLLTDLWSSDGTAIGTKRLKTERFDDVSMSTDRDPKYFELDGEVYFRGNGNTPFPLLRTSGTQQSTELFLPGGVGDPSPMIAVPFGGAVLALAQIPSSTSDGLYRVSTGGAVTLVHAFGFDLYGSEGMTATDSHLFLFLLSALDGYQLWASDGTSPGTVLVNETPDTWSDPIPNWAPASDRVFFTAWDEDHGVELWSSDGTPEGTERLSDIAPGLPSSQISHLTPSGCKLYFLANDGLTGNEPWAMDINDCGNSIFKDGFESGNTSGWSG